MTDPCVISRLIGGTGNQLFQYAAGRAMADRLGCDLLLDTRYLDSGAARGDCFAHFANARFRRTGPLPPAKSDGLLRYGLWRAFGRMPRFYRERRQGFDPQLLSLPAETYLHGYWQSERFFAPVAEQLRTDLRFTSPLDPANAAIAAQIAQARTPVSVHVRRGDYEASGAYAACPPAYYTRATAHLANALGPLTCFVFSNDPGWARAHLDLGQDTVIVDVNDEAGGVYDLHLQSLCAHHIIANSTFSWWGAWLNPSSTKQVIAPRGWFAKGAPDNPDLIPASWVRL